MCDISIVIVNYNVKHFLDQCLRSVFAAVGSLSVEVFVVDNDSIDGSVEHVQTHFPDVKLIANKVNIGFAAANNQAIKTAEGKYVLLLNPDTILEKDTLKKCYLFMEEKEECGALGVKMIDGEGKFLPESKRGFPTPFASLMRLTGLSKLFPKSRLFNRYNLGFLHEDKIHEIDVLSGAFMFLRNSVIQKVGLLDESFFMYGEDIDYSYRIQKAGYKIFYYPKSVIVHFKGESTKKSSIRYYSTFYSAMAIFAKKHFGNKGFNPFLLLVNIAIVLIGLFNYISKKFSSVLLPILEAGGFYFTLKLIEVLWAKYHFADTSYYDDAKSAPFYLTYSIIWVFSLAIAGSYKITGNFKRYFWGVLGGSSLILIIYALLDNEFRHSRAIILLASGGIVLTSLLIRYFYALIFIKKDKKNGPQKRVIAVGTPEEIIRTQEILKKSGQKQQFLGALYFGEKHETDPVYLQSLDNIEKVVEVYKIDEVLFSSQTVPMGDIMKWMTVFGAKIKVKIISKDVQSIIGSHDRNSRGDLYTVELKYNINEPVYKLLKMVLDYIVIVLILPFLLIYTLIKLDFSKLSDVFSVFSRSKTWVGYFAKDLEISKLPPMPEAVVPPVRILNEDKLSQEEIHSINFYYAKDYSPTKDVEVLLVNIRRLFQK